MVEQPVQQETNGRAVTVVQQWTNGRAVSSTMDQWQRAVSSTKDQWQSEVTSTMDQCQSAVNSTMDQYGSWHDCSKGGVAEQFMYKSPMKNCSSVYGAQKYLLFSRKLRARFCQIFAETKVREFSLNWLNITSNLSKPRFTYVYSRWPTSMVASRE